VVTVLSRTKRLLTRDSLMLDRARTLLVYELSELMGETESRVEEKIDSALETSEVKPTGKQ